MSFKIERFFINYKYNGKYHRIGMPSSCFEPHRLYWDFNGKKHRINGSRLSQSIDFRLYEKPIDLNISKLVI